MMNLPTLADYLATHPTVVEKAKSLEAGAQGLEISGNVWLGEDCAVIPNPAGVGYLIFSAEGLRDSLVEDDPWFAGYAAVMVNLSDIAAMGGRALAITDVICSPSEKIATRIWQGMQAAAQVYGVAIVGGHTVRSGGGGASLSVAVTGHASHRLMNRFDAKPGDHLVIAIDLHGGYRDGRVFWNSSTITPSQRLQTDLEMLPSLAEKGLCRAGKNISHGGIIGALLMLCHFSQVGVLLDLESLPCPMDVEMERWLVSSPSYGFLLAISPENLESTLSHFTATRITCREIGQFTAEPEITIVAEGDFEVLDFKNPASRPLALVAD
jgi:AIR synthase-related protein